MENSGCSGCRDDDSEDASCCPLPPGVPPLPLQPALAGEQPDIERLSLLMVALADPNRLRMLSVMARLQGHPRGEMERSETHGICVCELQSISGSAQSKVSYHLRVLREAGIVRETQRGKWRFYAIDPNVTRGLIADLAALLGV